MCLTPFSVSSNFPSLSSPLLFVFLSVSFLRERHARRTNRDEFLFPPYSARVCVSSLLVWDPPAKDLASLDVDLCGSHLNPAPFVFVRVADSRVFRRPLNESRFGEWLCKYEGRLIVSRFALYNVMLVRCFFSSLKKKEEAVRRTISFSSLIRTTVKGLNTFLLYPVGGMGKGFYWEK